MISAEIICSKCKAPREPGERCKPCRSDYLKTYRQGHPEDRDTEQIKLRVSPADASMIRLAAEAAGLTISDYLVRLHQGQPLPPRPTGGWQTFDLLESLRREVEAVPNVVRKLDADLGRLSGRIKDLFDTNPVNAMKYRDQINAALRAVRELRAEIMPVLADLQMANAEPRDRIEEVLVSIMPRRARE